MQDFRRLHVWVRAHAHILKVRKATKRFPRTGYSDLKRQITSSAESIGFNIVEGCGSSSQKELARFLEISIKSTMELDYQLEVSKDYGILEGLECTALSKETVEIRQMLIGLRRKVLESDSSSGTE
jgi:four helix bundle protein